MEQGYTSSPLNPQSPPQETKARSESMCYTISCWIFQVLVWGLLATLIIFLVVLRDQENVDKLLGGLGLCYLTYLFLEFYSSTSRYLCHKNTGQGMYEKMGCFFRTYPYIQFYCECYHYHTVHYTEKTKNGTRTRTRKERRVTHKETFLLPYYSSRDVSGLFYLHCEEAYIRRKSYIKLELQEEINFADPISYMDYEYQKDAFWRRNRFRDVYMAFEEKRYIPGLTHHNLIKLGETEPFTVNFFFFFLSTILTFAEFYKIYVDSWCVFQVFKLRKLVSTRYDLNAPVYVERYIPLVPQLNLISQQYSYEPTYYNYLNSDYQVKIPTEQELEMAQQYQSKIPDYHVSSSGNKFEMGVIQDDPSYSSYSSEPPPAFSSVGGNVGLSESQINAEGSLPSNFGTPNFQFSIAPPVKDGEGGYSSSGTTTAQTIPLSAIPPNN